MLEDRHIEMIVFTIANLIISTMMVFSGLMLGDSMIRQVHTSEIEWKIQQCVSKYFATQLETEVEKQLNERRR